MLRGVGSDFRSGLHELWRRPGLTLVAVTSIALGVGANAAIFSIVHATLQRPLGVSQPDRLVSMFRVQSGTDSYSSVSYPDYNDLSQSARSFSGLAASADVSVNITVDGDTELAHAAIVSSNYFSVLGVLPAYGRDFLPEEGLPSANKSVAILSYKLWQKLGSSPGLIGATVTINGYPFVVVGVVPRSFTGLSLEAAPQIWVPLGAHSTAMPGFELVENRGCDWLDVDGRLRPETSLKQSQTEIRLFFQRLEEAYPESHRGWTALLIPTNRAAVWPPDAKVVQQRLNVIWALAALLLLIACGNVANLQLARGLYRQGDVAVRLSLGASRWRLVRQSLIQSLLLAMIAGTVGFGITYWTSGLLRMLRLPGIDPASVEATPDFRVLGFSLALSLLAVILFGSAPAWYSSRADIGSLLRSSATGRVSRGSRYRSALIAAQVALSCVVMVAASLLARSFIRQATIEPGFDARNVAVLSIQPSRLGYDEPKANAFYKQLVSHIEGIPRVSSVSLAYNAPLDSTMRMKESVLIDSAFDRGTSRNGIQMICNLIGPRYFDTMGIPLLSGRDFTDGDGPKVPRVAIINRAMANRLWPGATALGRKIRLVGRGEPIEIVGIAANAKYFSWTESAQPGFYLPLAQRDNPDLNVLVRVSSDPDAVLQAAVKEVKETDPMIAVESAQTLSERVKAALLPGYAAAALGGGFATVVLFLALIGISGTTAFAVARQRREIGIRIALGAQRRQILTYFIRQALTPVVIGAVFGLALTFIGRGAIASYLYGVDAADPVSFAVVPLTILVFSLLAAWVPASRVTVDPNNALRSL